jgi:hypothetical protein
MTKIYLVNEYWMGEGHDVLGAFRTYSDAQSFLIQYFINKSRLNVSAKRIIDICFNFLGSFKIEEVEIEGD